ncbi:hypothetical protein PCC7424_5884 (plasmid) [Gloeothece citriformis PCC 7424]|uniref:Uncharacterized protein n=1 Tax=Gloeothece citriformis (strain PCC 7424) TaxID=65393 RepID=B7KMA9_GLOC7|nr:hypothetical protein [Gloeothece citriformis]ACK73931.1 hypothetical protein PCC7424_5884 [Gloeothece citriformis PCC 7424]
MQFLSITPLEEIYPSNWLRTKKPNWLNFISEIPVSPNYSIYKYEID